MPPKSELDAFLEEWETPPAPVDPADAFVVEWKDDRRPTPTDTSQNRHSLLGMGGKLGHEVRRTRLEGGATEAEAQAAAERAEATIMAVGEYDEGAVYDQLRAHLGQDTLDKTLTRVFGQRVIPMPEGAPDRDAERRRTEEEMRRATSREAIDAAWEGEDVAPVKMTEDEIKPWLQRAKDNAAYIIASASTGGYAPIWNEMAGGDVLPEWHDPMAIVSDYLNDRDVVMLAKGAGPLNAASGLLAETPIPDVAVALAEGAEKVGLVDKGRALNVAEWVDHTRDYEAFDAANEKYVTSNDRSGVDALPYESLPAMLQGEIPEVERFVRVADKDPRLASIAAIKDRDPSYIMAQLRKIPVGVLEEYQPDIAPKKHELYAIAEKRNNARGWRGTDEGQSFKRLASAGLLTPVGNATDLMVVPGKIQEAMRLAGAGWAGLQEMDVPLWATYAPQIGIPLALAGLVSDKARDARFPTAYGIEQMAESGSYDDWMGAAGLGNYAGLDSPESTWLSRTLADVVHPDYASRWLEDPYLRAGGDPHGSVAKALATADVVGQFVIPVEELAMAPVMKSVAAANRARVAGRAAREVGQSGAEVRRAMLGAAIPGSVGAVDGVEAVGKSITDQAVGGLKSGTINPNKIGRHARRQVGEILREAVGLPEAETARLLDEMADRHAAILTEEREIDAIGGPRTRALRDSREYGDVASQLERLPNLAPLELDLVLRMLEAKAMAAVEEGVVGSPEEFFGRHEWRVGVDGDVGTADTLYSASDRYDALVAEGRTPVEAAGIMRRELPRQIADMGPEQREVYDWLRNPTGKPAPRPRPPSVKSPVANPARAAKQAEHDALSVAIHERRRAIVAEGGNPWADQGLAAKQRELDNIYFQLGEMSRGRLYSIEGGEVAGSIETLPDSGRFDPDDPSILYSKEDGTVAGSIETRVVPERHPVDRTPDDVGPMRIGMGHAEIEPLIMSAPQEHLVIIAPDGRHLGRWIGENDYVPFPSRVLDSMSGALITHNHPRVTSLSAGDLVMTLRADLSEVRAVTPAGDVYVLRRPTAGWGDRDALMVEAAKIQSGVAARARARMQEIVVAAGGNVADGNRALGFKQETWTDLLSEEQNNGIATFLAEHAPGASYTVESPGNIVSIRYAPPDGHLPAGWQREVAVGTDPGVSAGRGAKPVDDDLLQRASGVVRGSITPELTRVTDEVPNPARSEWETRGRAAAARVRELEAADPRADLVRQRDTLNRNPQPDDPDWQRDLDDVTDRLADLPDVSPELTAARAELARLRAQTVPRTIAEPREVANYLLKLYRTGNVRTALHEGTHLFDLMMGPDFTRRAAKALGYTDAQIDEAFGAGGDGRLLSADGGVRGSIERTPVTSTPSFRQWFGNSKVMKKGKPLVVYHGTGKVFDTFDPETRGAIQRDEGGPFDARSREGFWFTSEREVASSYADETGVDDIPTVMETYLRIENPKEIRFEDPDGDFLPDDSDQIIKDARAAGHDGVIFRRAFDGLGDSPRSDVYVVFEPTQIKSATGNRGTFTPTDPNILHSGAPRANDLRTQIREAIAEAGTRALRGKLRPGSRIANLMDDFTDTMSDVWARVRKLPHVTTPEFRRLWDDTLRPGDASRPMAVRIVDERLAAQLDPGAEGGPFRPGMRTVSVPANVAERLRTSAVRAEGTAREAVRVDRPSNELRAALGIPNSAADMDAAELIGRALGYIATERVRKQWGFGELEALTSRVAVPVARAKRIKQEVAATRRAALGKVAPPKNGVFTLNADQQAGMRRMLDVLADSPLANTLPERLLDDAADLSRLDTGEWNAVVTHQTEAVAGMGAFRERRAERAAQSGAKYLLGAAVRWAEGVEGFDYPLHKFKEMFSVTSGIEDYMRPAVRDVAASFAREVADDLTQAKGEIIRAMRGDRKTYAEVVRRVAMGAPPEVVPVDQLGRLATLSQLETATDIKKVTAAVPEINRLFAASPVDSAEQALQESVSLGVLDSIGQRTRAGMMFEEAVGDAGHTVDQVNDAMSIVQEGIRRRSAAVQNAGATVYLAFAGSMDDAALAAMDEPIKRNALLRRVYAAWYEGRWDQVLVEVHNTGGATSGPNYSQGTAALTAFLRLRANSKFSQLADRLAAVGVTGDVADLAKGGRDFDRPYTLGSTQGGREVYTRRVASYIKHITGWTDTHVWIGDAPGAPAHYDSTSAPGIVAADGAMDPAAYADAERIISQYGFKRGKGLVWDEIDLADGGKILVPKMLREVVEDAINRLAPSGQAYRVGAGKQLGEIVPGSGKAAAIDKVAASAAVKAIVGTYQLSFGLLKTGMTTGIGPLIRPAFFIGNLIGGAFQLYQGVGAIDALRIMSRPLLPTAEGAVIRRVIWHMFEGADDVFMPAEKGFFTGAGAWHTDRTLAAGVNRAGLNSSLAKTELTATIIKDIQNAEPTMWNKAMRWPRGWQDFLREGATAIDNYYRVSTYVDGIKRGMSEEAAADLARKVAFDYNAITEFERRTMRHAVMFYSYQRASQGLFWDTLLTHPSRILGQLRLLRGLQQQNLGEDSEAFLPPWADGRLIASFREPLKDGHMDDSTRGMATVLPSTGVAENIGFWLNLLGAVQGEPAGSAAMMDKLNPWFQLPMVMYSGVDPYMRRPIDGYNTVPNWLVEMDHNLTGGMLVRDIFRARRGQARDETSESYPGAPVWTVGEGEGARAWWIFRNLLPTGMATDIITQMQRADVPGAQAMVDLSALASDDPIVRGDDVEMARPGVSEGEELAKLFGATPIQIPTRQRALDKGQERKEAVVRGAIKTEAKGEEGKYR